MKEKKHNKGLFVEVDPELMKEYKQGRLKVEIIGGGGSITCDKFVKPKKTKWYKSPGLTKFLAEKKEKEKLNAKALFENGHVESYPRDFFVNKGREEIMQKGELDLGFCTIYKKEIRGGKGKSHNTKFKIGKFYKLGVKMSKEFKRLINK